MDKLAECDIRFQFVDVKTGCGIRRYKYAMIRKRRNQKEIEVGKTKLTIRYLYLENIL